MVHLATAPIKALAYAPTGLTSPRFDVCTPDHPGDPDSPVWIPCGIAFPSGEVELGMALAARPGRGWNAPTVVRLTSLHMLLGEALVDLKNPAERSRAGLCAKMTFPLRIRLLVEPPFSPVGLDAHDRGAELAVGVWSRPLQPVDFASEFDRLAPLRC